MPLPSLTSSTKLKVCALGHQHAHERKGRTDQEKEVSNCGSRFGATLRIPRMQLFKGQGRQQPSRKKGTFRSFTHAQRSCSALDGRRIRHGESSPTPEKQSYRVLYKQECQVSSKEASKPRTLLYQHGPRFCRGCSLFGQQGKIIPVNVIFKWTSVYESSAAEYILLCS